MVDLRLVKRMHSIDRHVRTKTVRSAFGTVPPQFSDDRQVRGVALIERTMIDSRCVWRRTLARVCALLQRRSYRPIQRQLSTVRRMLKSGDVTGFQRWRWRRWGQYKEVGYRKRDVAIKSTFYSWRMKNKSSLLAVVSHTIFSVDKGLTQKPKYWLNKRLKRVGFSAMAIH